MLQPVTGYRPINHHCPTDSLVKIGLGDTDEIAALAEPMVVASNERAERFQAAAMATSEDELFAGWEG